MNGNAAIKIARRAPRRDSRLASRRASCTISRPVILPFVPVWRRAMIADRILSAGNVSEVRFFFGRRAVTLRKSGAA